MCAVAGALYVPQVGIINPSEMTPAASIEIAIWAAVGGRATLIGPIVGAVFVNGAKSWFTQAFPEYWLYFLGALFIAVTLFLPNGIVGLLRRSGGLLGSLRRPAAAPAPVARRQAVQREQGVEVPSVLPPERA
jgi:urea transport system permease protein